jgi:hypothetical protein
MQMTVKMTTAAVLFALSGIVAAAPVQAGILITPEGISITGPDPSLSTGAVGKTRWGSPARGFRRFGRDGQFFAHPRDPGLPFHGRTAYGAAGRQLDDAIRAERRQSGQARSSIFTWLFN